MKDRAQYENLLITNRPEKGNISVNWLGTAGLYIADETCGFYIDPYVSRSGLLSIFAGRPLLSRPELVDAWIEKTRGRDAKAVFVSHSHFDHVLDAPAFAGKTGARLIGSESTAWVGKSHNLPGDQLLCPGGEKIILGNFTITVLESRHGPALLGRIPFPGVIDGPIAIPSPAGNYRLGKTYSLVIRHPSGTFVHHGSAGFLPGMYDGIRADVIFLGITGAEDLSAYMEAVPVSLGVKMLIPIHFDNFFKPLEEGKITFIPNGATKKFWKHMDENDYVFKVGTLPIGRTVGL